MHLSLSAEIQKRMIGRTVAGLTLLIWYIAKTLNPFGSLMTKYLAVCQLSFLRVNKTPIVHYIILCKELAQFSGQGSTESTLYHCYPRSRTDVVFLFVLLLLFLLCFVLFWGEGDEGS